MASWKRRAALELAAIGLTAMAVGCTRKIYVPVHHESRDTLIQTNLRVDTIAWHDSIYVGMRGDTIIREVYRNRRYTKLRVDTVYKSRTDTIVRTIYEKPSGSPARSPRMAASAIKWGPRLLMIAIALCLVVRNFKKKL